MTQQIAGHMPLVYTPKFWDPAKAYAHYIPDIEGAKIEGAAYARAHGLEPAHKLLARPEGASMAFLTDLQDDFRDDGRLPVKGTNDVILRCASRLINGFICGHYAFVKDSRDGHPGQHISYGSYYRTQKGELFDLRDRKAAILELVDEGKCIFKATCFNPNDGSPVDAGYVQPIYDPRDVVAYNKHLVATGQAPQWAFAEHCQLGTDGTNLHPFIVETISFVSGLRSFVPGEVAKGHLINTDWFGPLEPCRPDTKHPQGEFQKGVVDGMKPYKSVEFFGIAQDFCDYWMKKQTLRYLSGTEYERKLVFVEDGTAAIVPNAAHVIEQDREARARGVKFIRHDTPFAQSI